MPQTIPFTKPVEDSVAKVDDAVAVGEDLDFQRRWWRFERITWVVFALIILADVLGLFGRGYLAKAVAATQDGAMRMTYERVERAGTPSIMTFRFGPAAVHDGKIQLFVSEAVVKDLGAQRISPQPASSVLSHEGIVYTFPATDATGVVEISLEPSFPGIHHFTAGLAGQETVTSRVIVVP